MIPWAAQSLYRSMVRVSNTGNQPMTKCSKKKKKKGISVWFVTSLEAKSRLTGPMIMYGWNRVMFTSFVDFLHMLELDLTINMMPIQ
jgi:hypothetical protein